MPAAESLPRRIFGTTPLSLAISSRSTWAATYRSRSEASKKYRGAALPIVSVKAVRKGRPSRSGINISARTPTRSQAEPRRRFGDREPAARQSRVEDASDFFRVDQNRSEFPSGVTAFDPF